VTEGEIGRFSHYGAKSIARDVRELQRQLKLTNKISFFGHSFGAKIVLAFLVQFPQNVKAASIYGDYEVPDQNDLIKEATVNFSTSLNFRDRRLKENPRLFDALKSLYGRLTPSEWE
jgi:pimeloyl-ACP methyl ester carboxylesterase